MDRSLRPTYIVPKSRSDAGPRSSLSNDGLHTVSQADLVEAASGMKSRASQPRFIEAAYHPLGVQQDAMPISKASSDSGGPARDEFLAKKAKELGFSVEELESAIEAWTKSVEDPYQKGLAALYNGRYSEASEDITASPDLPEMSLHTMFR